MAIGVFIPIILLVAIGVACLRWLPRGRKVGGIEPRCAGCGYIVHGLPAPRCPECGSDLAKPNAIVTTGRLPPGRFARFTAWSVFCGVAVLLPVAVMWATFVAPRMPQMHNDSGMVTLWQPVSGGYRSIDVSARWHYVAYRGDPQSRPEHLKIDLTRSDGTIQTLILDPATLHFRDSSVSGTAMSSTPLDANALVAWLKSAGVQGEATQLNREMSIAMTEFHEALAPRRIRQPVGSQDFAGFSSSTGGSSSPLPWVGSVPFIVGAIVWALGSVRILLKRSA